MTETATTNEIDLESLSSEQMIQLTLKLFCGSHTEIRCLGVSGRKSRTDSGYFKDFRRAAKACEPYIRDKSTKGVYFVLNRFSEDLIARSANRIEEYAESTTADKDITRRRWLLVDFDSVRPTGISATAAELETTRARAMDAVDWLKSMGTAEPVFALSGNGFHVLLPIDLPNDDGSLATVQGVLKAVADRFEDDAVSVDQSVKNAARICRLYGTIARKGDDIPERPHRMARLVHVPDYLQQQTGEVCDPRALQAIASLAGDVQSQQKSRQRADEQRFLHHGQPKLKVRDYLMDHGYRFEVKQSGDFTNYVLEECPFNSDHKSPDSMVTQGSDGGVQFKCLHSSCSGNRWEQLKALLPPSTDHYDPPLKSREKTADRPAGGMEVLRDRTRTETPAILFHDAKAASRAPKKMREVIIEGLLRRGEVGNFIASTKTGKSWFAMQLLWSIVSGQDWLGKRVLKGNVLLIDNELHDETIQNRLAAIRQAMFIDEDPEPAFEYVVLRGNWLSLEGLANEIAKRHPPGTLNLILLDAKYRFFGNGLEENSNDDQTHFHNMVDRFAQQMNAAVVMVHHATKGDQSSKAVVDMGAGGGSQARTVDLQMVLREHQQPEFSVLEAGLRSFVKVDPLTVRFDWPLWSVVKGVEAVLPKNAKEQARRTEMSARVRKYLSEDWQTLTRLAERCSTKKDRPPFADIIDEMEQAGELERTDEFTPPRSNKTAEAVRLLTSDKTTSDTVRGSLSGVRG